MKIAIRKTERKEKKKTGRLGQHPARASLYLFIYLFTYVFIYLFIFIHFFFADFTAGAITTPCQLRLLPSTAAQDRKPPNYGAGGRSRRVSRWACIGRQAPAAIYP